MLIVECVVSQRQTKTKKKWFSNATKTYLVKPSVGVMKPRGQVEVLIILENPLKKPVRSGKHGFAIYGIDLPSKDSQNLPLENGSGIK